MLWDAILGFKDFVAIENLFIDLKFIQDFVPEGITIFESYEPCQYLIGAVKLIMTKSMKGMEGDQDIDDLEDQEDIMNQIMEGANAEEEYSDHEFENPLDDPIVNKIKRLSRNLDESNKSNT